MKIKLINKITHCYFQYMKAAVFEKPSLENLKVTDNAEQPKIGDHDVLIKVKMAGVNPIDNFVLSGALPKLNPFPHIPGAAINWHSRRGWQSCQ
jgi:D-arabinose 1-dehydrogenase-like Zn-dependent alcohol dehydrogenase